MIFLGLRETDYIIKMIKITSYFIEYSLHCKWDLCNFITADNINSDYINRDNINRDNI